MSGVHKGSDTRSLLRPRSCTQMHLTKHGSRPRKYHVSSVLMIHVEQFHVIMCYILTFTSSFLKLDRVPNYTVLNFTQKTSFL